MSEKIGHRDALYLFACHLEWRTKRDLAAYQELLSALDDQDAACLEIRGVCAVSSRVFEPVRWGVLLFVVRHTLETATFAAWQNLSCIEARQGRSALRPLSNPGEGAAVPRRKTIGKLFALLSTGEQWQHRR